MEDCASVPSTSKQLWPKGWMLVVLILSLLMVIGVRLRTLNIALERDEGEFAYAGQLLLQGIPPYKLAYNMKLPGTYAGYAGIMALFGQTAAGIHLGLLLINLGAIALLFFLARRLLDASHAAIACVCYAVLSMDPGLFGLHAHATHFVVLAALGGLLLLLKGRDSTRNFTIGWSGFLFGLAFVFKQPGLVFGLFGLAILLRDVFAKQAANRAGRIRRIGVFCAGMALPFLLTCAWMAWAGTFDRFWFWTVTYARAHADVMNLKMGTVFFGLFFQAIGLCPLLAGLAALGSITWVISSGKLSEELFILLGLMLASLIAFGAGFYFFPHYLVMVLPAISLWIAVLIRKAAVITGEAVPGTFFGLAFAGCVLAHHAIWFEQSPEQISRTVYGNNPFPESIVIAKYLEEHTAPSATVAVIGSEPEIYFYAHRHSATGYIYMYDLTQYNRYAAQMQREMIDQVESSKPEYLVIVDISNSWSIFNTADITIFNWANAYAQKNYVEEGRIWVMPGHTEYCWGKDSAKRYNSPGLIVLKRKPAI